MNFELAKEGAEGRGREASLTVRRPPPPKNNFIRYT